MSYRVEVTSHVSRQLRKLSRQVQVRLVAAFESLGEDPRPQGAKALEGSQGLYRIREGDYRIIYQVQDEVLLVLVVEVGHRREVYRHRPQ